MIVVHHLNHSRSQRVLWLLEELGVEYEIKHYERDPKTSLAPATLRAVHPLGKSPVITDGGLTIAESAAILEYLVDRYGQGRFRPAADSAEYLRYRYWLHYAEGSLMPWLLLSLVFARMAQTPAPFFVRPIMRQISKRGRDTLVGPQLVLHLDYMESELARSTWFAGEELSAADMQMSFPVEAAVARADLDTRWPRLVAFRERVHARPAYLRALARGGPFELLR